MTSIINFIYFLKHNEHQQFSISIPEDSTFKDVLNLINKKHNDNYKFFFNGTSELYPDDLIINFIMNNPKSFFIASLDSNQPSQHLIEKYSTSSRKSELYSSKPVLTPEISKIPPPKMHGKISSPDVKLSGKIKEKPIDHHKKINDLNNSIQNTTVPVSQIILSSNSNNMFSKITIPPAFVNEVIHASPSIFTPTSQTTRREDSTEIPLINETFPLTFKELLSTVQIVPKLNREKHDDLRSEEIFTFYFTGGDKDMLLNGIQVRLNLSIDSSQCNEVLMKYLNDVIDTKNKLLLVYLPGGIQFTAGKLGDIFLNTDLEVNNVIYGVLTQKITETDLNNDYKEVCNIRDQSNKNLISPLVNSTDLGLSDMACLLGYFQHNGDETELFLKVCSAVIHFPPLITSLKRIINSNCVKGNDIVTVTSTFYTYFRAILPLYCHDDKVLEYSILLCNLMINIENPPEKSPLIQYDIQKGGKTSQFFMNLNLGNFIYFWNESNNDNFYWLDLKIQIDDAIEYSNKIISFFSPVNPISLKNTNNICIVKGKTHEYLYLKPSQSKYFTTQHNVDIINPITGNVESKDITSFIKSQKISDFEIKTHLINPNRVKQIILVIFDESKSMYSDLNGNSIQQNDAEIPRITLAYQLLTTFLDKLYYNDIPCIQSLVSFNNEIVIKYPFGPINPNSGIDCLTKKVFNSISKLWDSLDFSCDEIEKFRKDKDGKEIYENAVSRMLIISAGIDHESSSEVYKIVRKLIKNKIVVDSIILNTKYKCKMLCAVCHATGGLSFHPNNIEESFNVIEQSAFFNYEERVAFDKPLIPGDDSTVPSRLENDKITRIFMENAKNEANFDDKIENKELLQAIADVPLATPRYICSKYLDSKNTTYAQKEF